MNLARLASQKLQGVLPPGAAALDARQGLKAAVTRPVAGDAWPAHRAAPISALLPADAGQWMRSHSFSGSTLNVGMLNHQRLPDGTPLVAVLSEAGVRRVRREASSAYEALTRAYDEKASQAPGVAGVQATMTAALDWAGGDLAQVWVPRERYREWIAAYRRGIKSGDLPSSIGKVPYTEFFRPTDDVRSELQAWQLSQVSHGFAQRGKEEQRVVAALAHRLAGQGPRSVPYALRLGMSEALIRHERVPGQGANRAAAWRELASRDGGAAMPFHHGTRDAAAIVKEGFRPGENQLMGPGIYYGNASVAAQYANRGDGARAGEVEQIISGRVLPGKTVPEKLDGAGFADSAVSPQPLEGGSYWVTRDPQRFDVRSVTTHDRSGAAEQLKPFVPELLRTLALGPEAQQWAAEWLNGMNRTGLTREASRMVEDEGYGAGARMWLIRQGHEEGVSRLRQLLAAGQDPALRLSAASAALDGLAGAPPQRRQAMLKLLQGADRDLLGALIQARKTHPTTLVLARHLLRDGDHPIARERLLTALRRADSLTPDRVRESLSSVTPAARAALYFELGRNTDGLRALLADAATLAGPDELGVGAASLLLRRSASLDDAAWQRWNAFVKEADPDAYARLVVDSVGSDTRYLNEAIAVLEQGTQNWASQRAKVLLQQAGSQDTLLPFARAVMASGLSQEFKGLASDALLKQNSGVRV